MANIRATKNGVWSDATVWSPNPPTSTDDVFPVGFTIYVDQNITASSISTLGTTGIGGGGTFRPNNGVVMTTNVVAGSTTCVNFASASPNSFTLSGNAYGSTGMGSFNTNTNAINNSNTGTVNMIGNIYSPQQQGCYTVINNSTGTINVTGSILTFSILELYNFTASLFNSVAGTVNIYGNVVGGSATSSNGIYNNSTGVVTIYGTVSAGYGITTSSGTNGVNNYGAGTIRVIGNVYGSQNTGAVGIQNYTTGTVEVTGNVYAYDVSRSDLKAGLGGSGSHGLTNVSTGSATIIGNVYGGTRGDAWGVYNQAAGTITVVGSAVGGGSILTGLGTGLHAAYNNSTGTITISGVAIGGPSPASYGAFNNSTGILRVKRAVGNDWGLNSLYSQPIAYGSTPGVFSNNAGSQTFVEELQCGARGQWPTGGNVYFTANTKATSTFQTSALQTTTLIESNSADNLVPPVSSVKQGTTYNLGLSTGTCVIPAVSTVAIGVLVDNTVGTAVLTPANTWNYNTSLATDVNSLGGRLKDIATIQSVGQQLTAFNL